MMRNRWGVEIKKGYHAWATWGNQRVPIDGAIVQIDRTSDYAKAYGAQVMLKSGYHHYMVGADEITQVLPPMKIGRGGVVKANPAEIHIDIGSHNTKGRNVRAKNPDFTVSDFRREMKAGPYEWPGGYPRYFVTSDGEALSFKDAKDNARLIMEAIRDRDNSGWRVVGVDINWEDDELYSAHSGERIESAYSENPTPRLESPTQQSQRARRTKTGMLTKRVTPGSRLYERRLRTHHLAPPGVWANPLTRVKLKSPAQRPAGQGEVPEKGSRLYKRRQKTARMPPGFYANPADTLPKNVRTWYEVQCKTAKGGVWTHLASAGAKSQAFEIARAMAEIHPTWAIRVISLNDK